jgi:hypothetical protein
MRCFAFMPIFHPFPFTIMLLPAVDALRFRYDERLV